MEIKTKDFYSKAGETINRYELKIFKNKETPKIECKQIPIFCNSENQIVIRGKNSDFETILTKKHAIFSDNYVDNVTIRERDWNFDTENNGLYILIYTFGNKESAIAMIKKGLAEYLAKNSWMYGLDIENMFKGLEI